MKKMSKQTQATLLALLAYFLWGFSFLFSRLGMDEAPPFVMLAHRFTLAAAAMASVLGVPAPVIRHTLMSFTGVEHRIEKTRVLEGVTYINDSKGTNVDSTIKAVQSMKAPTVLLLGGYDKHTDFMPLCREIVASGQISHVVVMGETSKQIRTQLTEAGYDAITQAYSMQDAVEKARALAQPGGNVLLSPACASFDMFRDYEERGRIFKEIVAALN